ncbi:MAG TPA: HAMP domain-containing histidine kinase [Clostridiales bacterium]|nr:HAMP domain-containing histidine kinase [Clostridiales bacterium]
MLIVFLIFLVVVSVLLLLSSRNKETFYLAGMCLSLAVMLTGILIFIAKKGGISKELSQFFFLSISNKTKIQYMLILVDQLGYIIAIGRYLFPVFLMLTALNYSMLPVIRNNHKKSWLTFIIPVTTLIVYYPKVFRMLVSYGSKAQTIIISITNYWIVAYVAIAVLLLLIETYSISMWYFRKRMILIDIFIVSIAGLYLLYVGQDPAQVYQFYADDYIWKQGIYYMRATLSIPAYIVILIANLICAVVGIASVTIYTQVNFEANREEVIRQRKFNTISAGTSVFIHSIKNQLLANRVIYKRIGSIYQEDKPDMDKVKEYTDALQINNEFMLSRMNDLYRFVKTNSVHLIPVSIKELLESAREMYLRKYPEGQLEVQYSQGTMVLADINHLCEAIYNLMINAQEAINDANKGNEGGIILCCYNVRLYTVIEVVDNGIGMSKSTLKKIYDPFYSSKNSNFNWGMGLHYVREIVKEHFGTLRCESKIGEGSRFYVLLPKYKE